MKKLVIIVLIISVIILGSCGSIPGIPSSLVSAGQSIQSAAQVAGAIDFSSGEVLASDGTELEAEDMSYYVAKVMTPASTATKNQAEVLMVHNGTKAWSSFLIPSHKAQKAELVVGRLVFVIAGWADHDAKQVTAETYRQSRWDLGRITSVDELFKNRVEIDGNSYDPGLVRIPDVPLD